MTPDELQKVKDFDDWMAEEERKRASEPNPPVEGMLTPKKGVILPNLPTPVTDKQLNIDKNKNDSQNMSLWRNLKRDAPALFVINSTRRINALNGKIQDLRSEYRQAATYKNIKLCAEIVQQAQTVKKEIEFLKSL